MTRFFVNHPVTTWMIFGAFVLLGAYAVPRMQVEAMPEVELPTLTVQTAWNGASPQAIQRSITVPVEEVARKVHGVEKIESVSRAGWSQVEVSLRRGVDVDFARVELNEQLGSVRRNLPLNAGQPQILPYIPEEFRTEQFFTFSLESALDPNELNDLAEQWVVPQIIAIDGVADARVRGGARPLVKIYLDRQKLDLYGITPEEVYAAIQRLDDVDGGGTVYEAGVEKYVAIRDPLSFESLSGAVVAQRGGRTFTLGMLGEARRGHEDPVYFVRNDGQNVVQVVVEKRSGANSLAVSRALRDALPRIDADVPFDVTFHVDEDQGAELESKLKELVYRSLAILCLLFLLLVLSLRQVRLTAIVTGSIVFAIVISLSLFYFLRISVNFITISGLTVCFGMVLDNSILVLDAIHRRVEAARRSDMQRMSRAARLKIAFETINAGTREVLFPMLATTSTTIVAFVSFIFLSGRLALYYVPLGVSVATALVASVFVAFGWVPMVLHSWWAVPSARRAPDGRADTAGGDDISRFIEDAPDYGSRPPLIERFFVWTQRLWWVVVPCTLALFAWGTHVYDKQVIKGGFWRMPDIEELVVWMEMPAGTDVRLTSETMMLFERALLPVEDGARMHSQTWGNHAYLQVEFDAKTRRSEIPWRYRQYLMEEADKLGGTNIYILGFSDTPYIKGSFSGSTLNSMIKITGYNSKRLRDIAEKTLAAIRTNRRVRNATITTGSQFERAFQDEIVVKVDRDRMARHELTMLEFVAHLRRLLGVDTPSSLRIDDEQERVQLAYYDSESIELADAENTIIKTRAGETVRLGDIARAETQPLSGSITREDQRYTTYVNWEFVGTDQMRLAFIKRVLESLDLPYGFSAEESKREFFTEEEEEELAFAIVLTVLLIFIVLSALFESLTVPFLVILSVPMALVGVVVAFWLTRSSFDSSARIGLILLFGVVVNNAILLVSRFRTEAALVLKDRFGGDPSRRLALFADTTTQPGGADLWELPRGEARDLLLRSAARAVRIRIRSILLTTGTTIVGLAPLLVHFRETEDKDIWENLALASIGGLVSSTILVLVALPAFHYAAVRFVSWPWRSAWRSARRFGRWVMAAGAAYASLLVVSVAVALYVAHSAYSVTESGVEPALTEAHRDALQNAAASMAVALGLWSAAYGRHRAWWKSALGLHAGALFTAGVLSALALLELPFVTVLPGIAWLEREWVLLSSVWLAASACLRILPRLAARFRRDKTVIA